MTYLEMVRGDAKSFAFTATDRDGDPVDLTGATLRFVAKRLPLIGAAVIEKASGDGIEVTTAEAGEARIDIEPADTNHLRGPVVLHWDVQVTADGGAPRTVATGRLTVLADISRGAP